MPALCEQNVVVIGTGAFACEAMRAAVHNGAGRVTMVARSNARSAACMYAHAGQAV